MHAEIWWKLTRSLFAAKMLPVDAAGGKHRHHRYTIARYYVNTFMESSIVQDALNNTKNCAEIGDKHFLNFYAREGSCANKYAIDIKDPKADVIMNLMEPDWTLPGVVRGRYDAIVMNEVLEHIQQPEVAIKTLSELLSPGGVLIMTTPFLVNFHANPDDHNRYTPSAIRLMLKHAGLQPKVVEGRGNWLAATGYAAGFGPDELKTSQLDDKDWLEGNARPFHVTVVAIGYKEMADDRKEYNY